MTCRKQKKYLNQIINKCFFVKKIQKYHTLYRKLPKRWVPVRLKSGCQCFQTMTLFHIKYNYEDFVLYRQYHWDFLLVIVNVQSFTVRYFHDVLGQTFHVGVNSQLYQIKKTILWHLGYLSQYFLTGNVVKITLNSF